jgi:alpha-tubulin suppressor-like RCC1 family protein
MGAELPSVDFGSGLGAVMIAAGARHNCALLADARMKCWGSNDAGQLGVGDTDNRGDTREERGDGLPAVALDEAVAALALGANHSCVLTESGEVFCWGSNSAGQLGRDREMDDDSVPPAKAINFRGVPVIALSAGATHNCAVLDGGSLRCWGSNDKGQLGNGEKTSNRFARRIFNPEALPVPLGERSGSAIPVTDVSAGLDFTCAVLAIEVKCWGVNQQGQLGFAGDARGDDPDEMGDALPPVDFSR